MREQLEALPDARTNGYVEGQLERIDSELHRLHSELTAHWTALMVKDANSGHSFHDLMGQWLSICTDETIAVDTTPLQTLKLQAAEEYARHIHEILTRGQAVSYAGNPWKEAAGVSLSDFLAQPMDYWHGRLDTVWKAVEAADATADPTVPAFDAQIDLRQQSEARQALAERLQRLSATAEAATLKYWGRQSPHVVRRAKQRLTDVAPHFELMCAGTLDSELLTLIRSDLPRLPALAAQLLTLEDYMQIAGSWMRIFRFRRKSRAPQVLSRFGLPLTLASAQRVHAFLKGLRARLLVQDAVLALSGTPNVPDLMEDSALEASYRRHLAPVQFCCGLEEQTALGDLRGAVLSAMGNADATAAGRARAQVRVTILPRPLSAEVWLGGRSLGKGRVVARVPQGELPLAFTLRAEGFAERIVEVTPDRDQEVPVRLARRKPGARKKPGGTEPSELKSNPYTK
jgi:hypothetical protein